MPSRLDTARALSLMAELGVEHVAQRSIDALSGGERRLLLVARALAQEPQILLLDEPTAFLDLKHQVEVLGRVKARVKRGLAALAVVHDVNHAVAFADKVLLLKGGRVLALGSPEAMMTTEVLEQLYDLPIGSALTQDGQAVFAPRLGRPQ
jgi:iron complex transport system ATP-binding protein